MKNVQTIDYKPDYCDDTFEILIITDDITGMVDFYAHTKGYGMMQYIMGMFITELDDIMMDVFEDVEDYIINFMEENDCFCEIMDDEDILERMNIIRICKPDRFREIMKEDLFT